MPGSSRVIVMLSLALPLSLSGSAPGLDTLGLFRGPKQRASFHAIADYQACLRSAASRLRRISAGNPSDQQIKRLGFDCPTELDAVARTLVVRADWNDDDLYHGLNTAQRIEYIKRSFAEDAWCDFRSCQITD